MRNLIILVILLLAVSCGVTHPRPEMPASLKKESPSLPESKQSLNGQAFFLLEKDSNGNMIAHWRNVRYFFHTAMLSDIPVEFLVEEMEEIKENRTRSCQEGQLDLKFYEVMDGKEQLFRSYHSPAVAYEFIGNSGHLFRTDILSCNEHFLPLYALYSLKNEQALLFYYRKLNTLTLPANRVQRYIGFHPQSAVLKPIDKKDGRNLVGILYYSSDKGPGSALALRCNDSTLLEKLRSTPPQIFLTVERSGQLVRSSDMELYPEKGGAPILKPDGFNIEINMVRSTGIDPIEVPVVHDRPRPDLIEKPDERFAIETLR